MIYRLGIKFSIITLKRFKFCEGKTVSTVTNAVLKKIMNNVTATEYSWQGRKGKKSLHNLFRLSALIKKAVREKCPSCTDTEIESAIGYWLAQAKARIQRQNKEGNV
ncbi:hypothetical protein ABEB36_013191 [Hypothenemus hampei]|uniref:DUF4806 domain-containing protein n=1 Tax=Hypothenemus hampei TaxID=57062 RepID=A0ABD1E765_HYPHA